MFASAEAAQWQHALHLMLQRWRATTAATLTCLETLDWTVNMFVCWFASTRTFVRENFRIRWNLFYMGWFQMETHLCVIESWPSTVNLCCFHSCCRYLAAWHQRPMVTSFLRALGGTTQWLRALDVFRQLRREGTTRLESLLFGSVLFLVIWL